MQEYIKKKLSLFKSIYLLLKNIKLSFQNTRIFCFIKIEEIEAQSLNHTYYKFTKNNITKFFNNTRSGYIYFTDNKIDKNVRIEKLKKLIHKINNLKKEIIIYDCDCPYYSEIISINLLKKYSEIYPVNIYPLRFYYFYKKIKFQLDNLGLNHRIYNFNGTFSLPGGGRSIGDGGPVDFRLNFIPDLTNKTFLDIGTEEGYSVFNALSKNANFAKGLNIYEDKEYDYFPEHSRPVSITSRNRNDIENTISFLKKIHNLSNSDKISFEYKNIYQLKNEKFDFVFCFGVLYHLKNPYLAIENLYEITKEVLIIETQGFYSTDKEDLTVLILKKDGFVRHSPSALKFLLIKAGFKKVDVIFSGVNRVKRVSNIVLKAYKQ